MAQAVETLPRAPWALHPSPEVSFAVRLAVVACAAIWLGKVPGLVENNRIVEIRSVGYPGLPINPARRPAAGDREIDAHGMYVLPGFIDLHGHTHRATSGQGTPIDYVRKLWLGHGITTVREPSGGDPDWLLKQKRLSAANAITAPRFFTYPVFGSGFGRAIETPEDAREWVQMIAAKGADGIKFFGADGYKLADDIEAKIEELVFSGEIDYGGAGIGSAEVETSNDTLGKKIRNATTAKIPNALVIGEREVEEGTVTLRRYGSREQRTMPVAAFVEKRSAEFTGK